MDARIRVVRTTDVDVENGGPKYLVKITVELEADNYRDAERLNERLEDFVEGLKNTIKEEFLRPEDTGKRRLIL